MGLLENILAGGVTTALGAMGSFAKDLREAITGKSILDPGKQAELVLRAQEIEQGIVLAQMAYDKAQVEGQLAVNKAEAESGSTFKGGWRPAVGWVCVSGLFYEFILRPILPWAIKVAALATGMVSVVPEMPTTPMDTLMTLLFGMLGLGGMRMYEKVKGVAAK